MSPEQIHHGPHAEYIHDEQEYSYKWGRVLHAMLLQGEDTSGLGELNLFEYTHWLHDDFDVLHHDLRGYTSRLTCSCTQ